CCRNTSPCRNRGWKSTSERRNSFWRHGWKRPTLEFGIDRTMGDSNSTDLRSCCCRWRGSKAAGAQVRGGGGGADDTDSSMVEDGTADGRARTGSGAGFGGDASGVRSAGVGS
ncbi:unnamed protein product, partial [Phaeothamnion confervicola]